MEFPENHPRGPNGGPIFLGEELCPLCQCCSLSSQACDACGGDGYTEDEYDGFDSDGDVAECDICQGEGGFMVCLGGCDFDNRVPHKALEVAESAPARIAPVEEGKACGSATDSSSSSSSSSSSLGVREDQ